MAKYVIQASKGAVPQGAYSQGWRAGDFIFVTGTGPVDAAGKLVGDSIEQQTEQVITNMESVLAADHATLSDVVKVTVHLSDTAALFSRYNAVYARRFAAPYPVRTTVGSDLRQFPGMLIEADCIAYAPQRKPTKRKSKAQGKKRKSRRAR